MPISAIQFREGCYKQASALDALSAAASSKVKIKQAALSR
jgi:hypothetical protein